VKLVAMSVFTLCLAVCAGGFTVQAAELDSNAVNICKEYGKDTGLCAVVCLSLDTTSGFIAGVAPKNGILHVITTDTLRRDRLARELSAASCGGRMAIERMTLPPLPYLNNLVDLLVIDDMAALSALGVDAREAERVVVPGGVLAFRQEGAWKITRKSWPEGMDDWTHPNHDAGGNRSSSDKFVHAPFGYKWIDGIPVPEIFFSPPPTNGLLAFGDCKAMVTANGRFFELSPTEPENIHQPFEDVTLFLVARDAFNGLLLWKQPLGKFKGSNLAVPWSAPSGGIYSAAIIASAERVFAIQNGKLTAFNTQTGAPAFTCETEYPAQKILLSGKTLLAVRLEPLRIPGIQPANAAPSNASMTDFNAENGAKLWSKSIAIESVVASGDVVFGVTHTADPYADNIIACDLATGQERFSVAAKSLGNSGTPTILCAGSGYLIIQNGPEYVAVSAKDGAALWRVPCGRSLWGPVVDGQFWYETTAYDVATGKPVRKIPKFWKAGEFSCSPGAMVNTTFLEPKFGRFAEVRDDGKLDYNFFRGARSGCSQGWTPAEGMIFTSPESCENCAPAHPYGFAAIAPTGKEVTSDEFCAKREAEHGEAFGALDSTSANPPEWPTFRANPERSASSAFILGFNFHKKWETKVFTEEPSPMLRDSFQSRCLPRLGPPVCGYGKVIATVAERGEIIALDQQTGAEAWRYRAGSRIDTCPSLYRGGCFFGCNDGYVYALTARDGKLQWRVRLAPQERRMVEHGVVESVWPVYGAVLVYNNTIYASAGRNSDTDGGMVIAAFDPATGERKWVRHTDVVQRAKNDVLSIEDGKVAWQNVRLDPVTGAGDLNHGRVLGAARSGMWDATNLYLTSEKRMGQTFSVDGKSAWEMAWNERYIAAAGGDVSLRKSNGVARSTETLFGGPKATAVVVCPNAVIFGIGGPQVKSGRLTIYTYDNPESVDVPLDSGVVHDGIAVLNGGLAVITDNGSVAVFEKAPVKNSAAGFSQRVNCGGSEFKDPEGHVWNADQDYAPGGWGAIGGGRAVRSEDKLRISTPLAPVYLTERYGVNAYRFTVPNGRYQVRLHFIETYLSNDMDLPNADLTFQHRRFNVFLNAAPVLKDFEPREKGESGVPVVRQFETEVVNCEITLRFEQIEQATEINGIEILGLGEPEATAAAAAPAQAKPSDGGMTGNAAGYSLRVNCGGKAFKDSQGNEWAADQEFSEYSWGYIGGNVSDRTVHPAKPMTGTADTAMYLTERYGMSAYRFTVPAGAYKVVFHFNETYFGPGGPCEKWAKSNGPRRFSVSLSGKRILTDFNLLQEAKVENYTPVVRSFETEAVDGQIEIRFTSLENSAEVNGIEILGK